MLQCMGGWCPVREECALYVEAQAGRLVDRVCEPRRERPHPLTGSFGAWLTPVLTPLRNTVPTRGVMR